MNPFRYSLDNKRYHTLSYYNKMNFDCKIFKAVIDGGFTCPNIDGTKGIGGCIFCSGGSGYFTNTCQIPVSKQIELELARIHKKYANAKAMAYFQCHTNTYAPSNKLRTMFEEALTQPFICGLSIGTRPDCLPEDVITVLKELSTKTTLTVELGLQTVHDTTAQIINRCYEYSEFLDSYHKLKSYGIRVCIHLINGLPFETEEMMIKTAKEIGKLNPDALKIQLLHIIKGTKLEEMFRQNLFKALEKDQYVSIVTKQLEYIPSHTVIERITGDGDKNKLIAPQWSKDKISVLAAIDKNQALLNSWQGCKL